MENDPRTEWTVLTRYEGAQLNRIALPIGGIGTGTVSLGGRGNLQDFEIANRPAKGFTPANTFFALRTEVDGNVVTRLLEGPLPDFLVEGADGSPAPNHGLPRFRESTFEAAYPFGRVRLSDPDVPLAVAIEAFNPLIPGDSERSEIPAAVIRITLTNPDAVPVQASVCGSLQNFIGDDGTNQLASKNRIQYQEDTVAGLFYEPGQTVPTDAESWGTMALAVLPPTDAQISHRTAWAERSWGNALLDFWDDFAEDGQLEERVANEKRDRPTGSLAGSFVVSPGEMRTITFLLCWHFPNRYTWTPEGHPEGRWLSSGRCEVGKPIIGNYYTARYADAWEVATRTATALPELERDTVQFVNAFCASDLPHAVKEAALFNLSTLRTQTCFRTPDGHFFAWEGCYDRHGSCLGSCTHVWNYEVATPFLFADWARSFREIEFQYATDPATGHMRFRVPLPLTVHTIGGTAAADGQMGCLMKLYRDWKLSGDTEWLSSLWSSAKRAMEFCWIPGGWDADKDGVMEGCQHNTYDVEFYGPNPQMGTWYLGALRACEEMARHLGDSEFADTCHDLFEQGSAWIDAHLFNGEYYEQHILPPASAEAVAPGLRAGMGAADLSHPELQMGAACLVDQLVGQYMAHICGLGYLLKPEYIHKTLESLMRYNFQPNLWAHFNNSRTYAMADEAAMLIASYPHGHRPESPFPYCNEVMTGFEYAAATTMLYEKMPEEGLAVIGAIRARYDGRRRSPFDEAECGHHYGRALASWSAVIALTGFHYDGINEAMAFAAQPGTTFFWSNGTAWGTLRQVGEDTGIQAELQVLHGTLRIQMLILTGSGSYSWNTTQTIAAGQTATVTILIGSA